AGAAADERHPRRQDDGARAGIVEPQSARHHHAHDERLEAVRRLAERARPVRELRFQAMANARLLTVVFAFVAAGLSVTLSGHHSFPADSLEDQMSDIQGAGYT